MSDLSISAAKAYMQTAQTLTNLGQGSQVGGSTAGAVQGPGFGDILSNAVSSVSNASKAAEAGISSAAMGRADLVDVVTAVAAAEATMETVIAVRDEVIKAYQDIMRMPI